MRIFILIGIIPIISYADAQTWTIETHNGVTYGRSTDGQSWTTEKHNGITYGRSNDGKSWTEETHNGVTYVYPKR
jgi:hypothetical protein